MGNGFGPAESILAGLVSICSLETAGTQQLPATAPEAQTKLDEAQGNWAVQWADLRAQSWVHSTTMTGI